MGREKEGEETRKRTSSLEEDQEGSESNRSGRLGSRKQEVGEMKAGSWRSRSRKQDFPAATHDSLMGTKMKSFWKRSTCLVHVFTRLCFRFWILRRSRRHRVEQWEVEVKKWGEGEGGTHGRLVASGRLRRSRWFSLL